MHETPDVVIIGAGVNGASLAYHLASFGVRRIIVLEKQVAAAGATGLSSGLVRMHYTNEVEARLALSITSLRPARYFEHAAISDAYGYSDRPQEHTEPPAHGCHPERSEGSVVGPGRDPSLRSG